MPCRRVFVGGAQAQKHKNNVDFKLLRERGEFEKPSSDPHRSLDPADVAWGGQKFAARPSAFVDAGGHRKHPSYAARRLAEFTFATFCGRCLLQ